MRFLLFFLVSIALFSCKKEAGEYIISGFLVDASSEKGLPFAEIEVYENLAGSIQPKYLTTVVTDEGGYYTLKVKRDRIDYLTFKVNESAYFPVEEILYFGDLTLKETNVFHLATTAKSWAKVHLKSSSASNSLKILKGKGKTDCDECCPNGSTTFNGIFDTTFYCMNDGNKEYAFTYIINGGASSGVRSGITPSNDTLFLEVDF